MTYDNTNRGQIWGNKDKVKDTQPDYKGSINIDGREYWLSGWTRKPDANPKAPAMTFSVQPKDEAHQQGMEQVAQETGISPGGSFDDDSIPF